MHFVPNLFQKFQQCDYWLILYSCSVYACFSNVQMTRYSYFYNVNFIIPCFITDVNTNYTITVANPIYIILYLKNFPNVLKIVSVTSGVEVVSQNTTKREVFIRNVPKRTFLIEIYVIVLIIKDIWIS